MAGPDEFWGETPSAFMSLQEDRNKGIGMIEYCTSKLAHYMAPKALVVFKHSR